MTESIVGMLNSLLSVRAFECPERKTVYQAVCAVLYGKLAQGLTGQLRQLLSALVSNEEVTEDDVYVDKPLVGTLLWPCEHVSDAIHCAQG